MSDPKPRLFRVLAFLRLIPQAPKSISTTDLLENFKAEHFQQQSLQSLPGRDWQRLHAWVSSDEETLVFGLSENSRLHEPECWARVITPRLDGIVKLYPQPYKTLASAC